MHPTVRVREAMLYCTVQKDEIFRVNPHWGLDPGGGGGTLRGEVEARCEAKNVFIFPCK
jgi:hypothetical protein